MPVFAVMTAKGAELGPSRRNREQQAWDEHAAFFDSLVDQGVIILGGPIIGSDEDVAVRPVRRECEDEDTDCLSTS